MDFEYVPLHSLLCLEFRQWMNQHFVTVGKCHFAVVIICLLVQNFWVREGKKQVYDLES